MKTIILDGYQLAFYYQKKLLDEARALRLSETKLVIAAILFHEDIGSQLYTRLKKELAEDLGIEYRVFSFSVVDDQQKIIDKLQKLNKQTDITGIIIQKPWRKTWIKASGYSMEEGKDKFGKWWRELVSVLDINKDVDGLHPSNLSTLQEGGWRAKGRVLPATCQATIRLLEKAFETEHLFAHLRDNSLKTVIIGKSDLLGQPLYAVLSSKKCSVEMIGSQELKTRIEDNIFLKDADVIVTATGRKNLINGSMVKEGSVIIDVGEPNGDVDQDSVMNIAAAVTPVPGGVGPMTVVSLMENAFWLHQMKSMI